MASQGQETWQYKMKKELKRLKMKKDIEKENIEIT